MENIQQQRRKIFLSKFMKYLVVTMALDERVLSAYLHRIFMALISPGKETKKAYVDVDLIKNLPQFLKFCKAVIKDKKSLEVKKINIDMDQLSAIEQTELFLGKKSGDMTTKDHQILKHMQVKKVMTNAIFDDVTEKR